MRVADKMSLNLVRDNVAKNRSEMHDLQSQAATQKRVTKPSDDPVAATRVLSSRIDLAGHGQYLKNLNYARNFLEISDQALDDITQLLVRSKELTLSQSNDASANSQSRRVVATEVGELYNQLVQIGNRKLGDRYVFGGYRTTDAPFDYKGSYKGDSGEILIQIDKDNFVSMNIPGTKVFKGEGLSGDGVSHVTTQQATTIEELIEQRSQAAAEKLKAHKSQEQQHPELRGPAGTGQPRVRLDSGDAPKELVQTPSIGGLFGGGINLFDVINKLEVALNTNDKEGVQDSIERLDTAVDQVVLARAQIGARVMAIDSTVAAIEKQKVDTSGMISAMEDADTFDVVSKINKNSNTLKATMETSGKLIVPSLMDFIR